MASRLAMFAAIYSDSQLDVGMVGCRLLLHETLAPRRRNTYRVVEREVSRQAPKSASQKPCRCTPHSESKSQSLLHILKEYFQIQPMF